MKEFDYTITDPLGWHARPASLLVKETKAANSTITIEAKGKIANAKSMIAIMSMGIMQGDKVKVKIEGNDEEIVFTNLKNFFEQMF